MRRLSIAALMAVPLLLLAAAGKTAANPPPYNGFGAGDFALNLFKGIHQHGPLYNYGPYYGYYPFKPYGPWDAYLRYDPFFYGDPYANWKARETADPGNMYGRNQNLREFPRLSSFPRLTAFPRYVVSYLKQPPWELFSKHGCTSCGFAHASWQDGGWYRGHEWLEGGSFGQVQKSCSSCGGLALTVREQPTGDVLTRYSGLGAPEQSSVFYSATPTLNPVLDLPPIPGQTK